MLDETLLARASEILKNAQAKGLMLATAESCTGGLIAGCLTEIAGSSAVVERGFVTYSNEAKTQMLGVPADLIARAGAVDARVAIAMAEGGLRNSRADLCVAVTGVAGPGGGSEHKPVGLVHLAAARKHGETLHREMRYGDLGRDGIRKATIHTAFDMITAQLDNW